MLIKPNLLVAVEPERAATTHPAIVEAVTSLLHDIKADVWIGDSSGETMLGMHQARLAYEICGLHAVAARFSVSLVDFERFIPREVTYRGRALFLSGVLNEVDAVLSLPKMKTHTGYVLTGAVKNMYGLVPGHLKARLHARYPSVLDFAALLMFVHDRVRPFVTLLDAVVCMEDNGPLNGRPRQLGFMLASEDSYSLDTVIAQMMGVKPSVVPTLRDGSLKPVTTPLDGVDLPRPIRHFRLPAAVGQSRFAKLVFRSRINWHLHVPRVNARRCTQCGNCSRICPLDVVHPPDVDVRRCIGCLCCFEVCKSGAIRLRRRNALARLFPSSTGRSATPTQPSARSHNQSPQ